MLRLKMEETPPGQADMMSYSALDFPLITHRGHGLQPRLDSHECDKAYSDAFTC